MKGKIVAAVVVGLVIGLIASSLSWSEAMGQGEQRKQEREYKVVAFLVGPKTDRNVDEHKQQVDKLAAEGWEYVGLLTVGSRTDSNRWATGRQSTRQPVVFPGSNVLFKRSKR